MMSDTPKQSTGEGICPMCKRLKSRHTPEEMLACSKKLQEFEKNPEGGAGIE